MNGPWYIYMLKLSNGAYYTGISNNVPKRLKTHEKGKGSKYVRSYLPFKLVYTEKVGSLSEAAKREKAIKRLKHDEKKELIEEFQKRSKIMTFPIEPILDRIIIKKDNAEKDANGFHLPDTVKGRSRTGTVVAVGPGRLNLDTGTHLPLAVKAGDRVVLKEFDGYRFDWEGETYFVFTENEIIGKLNE